MEQSRFYNVFVRTVFVWHSYCYMCCVDLISRPLAHLSAENKSYQQPAGRSQSKGDLMFNVRPSRSLSLSLLDLKNHIDCNEPIENLLRLCREIGKTCDEGSFPFIYAAILEANKKEIDQSGQIGKAISLLDHAEPHPFAAALSRFLRERGCFQTYTTAFQSPIPYDVWTVTGFYQRYRSATLNVVKKFLATHTPPEPNNVSICEIGPGNGLLLADIISSIFSNHDIGYLNVVLIEKSNGMLEATRELLHKSFGSKVGCQTILAKVEDIKAEDMMKLCPAQKFWFVNGAASLHHMPADIKIKVFREFAKTSSHVLVSDFVAYHDLPERNSPELVYSAVNYYGYFIEDIWASTSQSEERRWLCICDLALTEAITVLSQPRMMRIDYHAPVEEWDKAAEGAGYTNQATEYTAWDESRAITFTATYSRSL